MMIAPNLPTEIPRDDIREQIMQESYPQYHQKDGIHYPRPSGFLKLDPSSLFQKVHWGQCDDDFLQAVRIRTAEGHRVHRSIQAILEGRKPPKSDYNQVQTKVDRFNTWKSRYNKFRQFTEPDTTIVSPRLGFGGTPDLVCRLDYEHNSVIDFKIGRKLHEVYWLQLESYAQLVEEEMDITIRKLHVLFLGAKNKLGYTLATKIRTDELRYRVKQLLNEWYTMFPEHFDPPKQAREFSQNARRDCRYKSNILC